jgi:hypothetical protein
VTTTTACPDCQVAPGQRHEDGCDIARCARTGTQRLQCGHDDCNTTAWTGRWPGEAECEEYGWYIREQPGIGWVPCPADYPEAEHDLMRLATHCRWDTTLQRWIRP